MQLKTFAQQFAGQSFDALFASAKLVRFAETSPGSGAYTVELWDASLGPAPTDAQIAAALAAPEPTLSEVAAWLVPATAAGLAAYKADLKDQVDAAAEALRLSLITPGSGQAMEYQETFNEAVLVSNTLAATPGSAIDAAKFPMLSASVGLDTDPSTGKPTVDVTGEARAVLAAYDTYQSAGAAIRGVRLRGKAAIDAANDVAGAQAAYAAIAWPRLG